MRQNAVYVFLMLIIYPAISMAQIHTGVYSVKGTASYSSSEEKSYGMTVKHTMFALSPGLTYFINDHIELNWSFEHSEMKSTYPMFYSNRTLTNMSIGARFYEPLDDLALFFGGGVGKSESSNELNYSLEGGFDYFVYQTIAVEPSVIYSILTNNDYHLTVIRVGVGFRYFMEF